MKNYIYMLAFMASTMTISSCSSIAIDDEDSTDKGKEISFLVGTPESATSRAIIPDGGIEDKDGDGNVPITWQTTDHLSLWGDSNLGTNVYMSYNTAGTKANYAYFNGYTDNTNDTKFFVLYPYQSDAKCATETVGTETSTFITASIPDEQEATPNSFDPAAAILTGSAASQQTSVILDHACTFLKIKTTKAFKTITVQATNNNTWYVAGTVKIKPASAGSTIADNTNKKYTITLKHKDNSAVTAGTYLIAMAPSTSVPALTVTVNYADGKVVSKSTQENASMQLASGTIYNLGTAPTSN